MQDRQRWSLSEFVFLLIITESALVCLGQTTPTDNELQDFPATGVRACCAPEKEETPEGEKEWISINYPVCGLSQILMLAKNFSVKPNGNLFLFHDGVSTYPPEEYCIADCLSSTNESEVRESLSQGWINGSKTVVLCIHYECWWKFYVFDPLLLSVTSASLAVALITYISIADLRKRQSNHSLICMLSALLLAFTTTLAIRFLRTVFSDHLCRLAGIPRLLARSLFIPVPVYLYLYLSTHLYSYTQIDTHTLLISTSTSVFTYIYIHIYLYIYISVYLSKFFHLAFYCFYFWHFI